MVGYSWKEILGGIMLAAGAIGAAWQAYYVKIHDLDTPTWWPWIGLMFAGAVMAILPLRSFDQ